MNTYSLLEQPRTPLPALSLCAGGTLAPGTAARQFIKEAGDVDTASALLTFDDGTHRRHPSGVPHTFFTDRFAGAYRAELTAFTEVVAGTRTSPCTVADALEAGWIAEAATLSVAERRPVRLEEVRKEA